MEDGEYMNAKKVVKEMLFSLIEFPDYTEGSCEDDWQSYSVNSKEKETFCSEKAEEILQGKIESLDDIQEAANGFAEECFNEMQNIYDDAIEDVFQKRNK